jgi:hypothetical protein
MHREQNVRHQHGSEAWQSGSLEMSHCNAGNREPCGTPWIFHFLISKVTKNWHILSHVTWSQTKFLLFLSFWQPRGWTYSESDTFWSICDYFEEEVCRLPPLTNSSVIRGNVGALQGAWLLPCLSLQAKTSPPQQTAKVGTMGHMQQLWMHAISFLVCTEPDAAPSLGCTLVRSILQQFYTVDSCLSLPHTWGNWVSQWLCTFLRWLR